MNTRFEKLLTSLVCALLSFPLMAIQSPQSKEHNDGEIEKITIYGQKTIRELNKEIQKITESFFKDYNKINKNNKYNVVCKKQSRANTSIKVSYCEPRYVKMHRAQKIDMLIFNNDPSTLTVQEGAEGPLAVMRFIGLAGVDRVPPVQNKKFHEHLIKLMEENPHLIDKYQKIIDLKEEYIYKKKNR